MKAILPISKKKKKKNYLLTNEILTLPLLVLCTVKNVICLLQGRRVAVRKTELQGN
jgi:hypothetical protein